MPASSCLVVLLALLDLAVASESGKKVCAPAPGFPSPSGRTVKMESLPVQLSRWDAAKKTYVSMGQLAAQALHDSAFSAMNHGPKVRKSDVRRRNRSTVSAEEFSANLPPVYFTGTLIDKFWLLDGINASAAPLGSGLLGQGWTAELKMLGYAIAPSTVYPIDAPDGSEDVQGFLIAQGNPFVMDPGNHTMEANLGGLAYMDSQNCTTLFPVWPDPYAITGRVLNTIDCHPASGMCFFSAWKFDGGMLPMLPDCLWYCRPDDMTNPSKCVVVDVLKDENGKNICRDYGLGGGVHGLTVMKSDTSDPSTFDLLAVFTAGMGYDVAPPQGSWMSMLKVSVSENEVKVKSQKYFGESLWNDTVSRPHDVGCDHAMLDDVGQVWVTTFRKENAGMHLLDYDTGMLQYSIHGFTDYTRLQYTYPAGMSGYGTLFQNNSMLTLATSAERMGIPITGTATMFFVDISRVLPTSATQK